MRHKLHVRRHLKLLGTRNALERLKGVKEVFQETNKRNREHRKMKLLEKGRETLEVWHILMKIIYEERMQEG